MAPTTEAGMVALRNTLDNFEVDSSSREDVNYLRSILRRLGYTEREIQMIVDEGVSRDEVDRQRVASTKVTTVESTEEEDETVWTPDGEFQDESLDGQVVIDHNAKHYEVVTHKSHPRDGDRQFQAVGSKNADGRDGDKNGQGRKAWPDQLEEDEVYWSDFRDNAKANDSWIVAKDDELKFTPTDVVFKRAKPEDAWKQAEGSQLDDQWKEAEPEDEPTWTKPAPNVEDDSTWSEIPREDDDESRVAWRVRPSNRNEVTDDDITPFEQEKKRRERGTVVQKVQPKKKVTSVVISASSEAEAIEEARRRGLEPVGASRLEVRRITTSDDDERQAHADVDWAVAEEAPVKSSRKQKATETAKVSSKKSKTDVGVAKATKAKEPTVWEAKDDWGTKTESWEPVDEWDEGDSWEPVKDGK